MLSALDCIDAAMDTVRFDRLTDNDVALAYLPLAWVGDHYLNYAQGTRAVSAAGRRNDEARASFRQQAPAGFDKDLRTCDDVGVAGVFTPVMTDAADRGYEQHARRHGRGENLGVMAGAAWHADRPAAGKDDARSFGCTLKCRIHHGGAPVRRRSSLTLQRPCAVTSA